MAASAATSVPTTAAALIRPPGSVHVIAFNASAVAGSAGKMSTKLKGQGYAVGAPGPDRKPPTDATVILFRPGFGPEAQALAAALGLEASAAQAAEANPSGWGNADIAVLIGNDVAQRI
jgi:hypothetical protein